MATHAEISGEQIPRGRYAPSPTGELHLGNASSALLAWLSVRARGGAFVMRVEDLDRHRVRPGLDRKILHELTWLGLDWDEGPDRGGPYAPYVQWDRRQAYREAFARLRAAGRVYACFCSRKDIAAAASAPQSPSEELRYPGTCRDLDPTEAERRIAAGGRHAWRFRVPEAPPPTFVDRVHGPYPPVGTQTPADFVVFRSDDVPAYQLAVVVDDAAMRMTEIVRGDDLLASTLRQLLLFEALGAAPPRFGHVPLLLGPDNVRLSKRHRGTTLRELRESGLRATDIVGRLAGLLGLIDEARPLRPADLVDGFALDRLRPLPAGIVVDTATWSADPTRSR